MAPLCSSRLPIYSLVQQAWPASIVSALAQSTLILLSANLCSISRWQRTTSLVHRRLLFAMGSSRRILPFCSNPIEGPTEPHADRQTSFNRSSMCAAVAGISHILPVVSTRMFLSFATPLDSLTAQCLPSLSGRGPPFASSNSGVLVRYQTQCASRCRCLFFPQIRQGGATATCPNPLVPYLSWSQIPKLLAAFTTWTDFVSALDCIALAHILQDSFSQRSLNAPVHRRSVDSQDLGDVRKKAYWSSLRVRGAKDCLRVCALSNLSHCLSSSYTFERFFASIATLLLSDPPSPAHAVPARRFSMLLAITSLHAKG